MFSARTCHQFYPKLVFILITAILASAVAPPGSVAAVNSLSLSPGALNANNLDLSLELANALPTGMMPTLGPDGEPVGFLMDAEALQQQSKFEPPALAEPISLSRVQSTYVAGGGLTGTLVLTFTVSNNLPLAILPNLPVSATITDTIEAISAIDFSNDPNVVRNVVIADRLTASAVWLDADPLPDRKDDQFIWNLGDVLPLSTVTATLRLEVPGSVADFTDLDIGATAYGTLQGRAVSASTAPATLAPNSFADWLVRTVDADFYDEYATQKAAELGNDWQQIFAYVRSLGYESYKGSLRGARGTLWSQAGNSLDQANLLVATLRGNGTPARSPALAGGARDRHGALDTARAQELILSMFPTTGAVVGYVPEEAEVSDPANDPQLLTCPGGQCQGAEAQDHWWVEAYVGGVWTALDPTFSYAAPGQTFATPQGGPLAEASP